MHRLCGWLVRFEPSAERVPTMCSWAFFGRLGRCVVHSMWGWALCRPGAGRMQSLRVRILAERRGLGRLQTVCAWQISVSTGSIRLLCLPGGYVDGRCPCLPMPAVCCGQGVCDGGVVVLAVSCGQNGFSSGPKHVRKLPRRQVLSKRWRCCLPRLPEGAILRWPESKALPRLPIRAAPVGARSTEVQCRDSVRHREILHSLAFLQRVQQVPSRQVQDAV